MLGGETQFRALVTGVSGQDGWYLAKRLLTAGCDVHGVVRNGSDVARLETELPGLVTHVADLVDDAALRGAVDAAEPDRIFNLAGSTSVARSWDEPVEAADVIGIGAVRLLNAAWDLQVRSGREVRFLQASSAEVFGDPVAVPQDEGTVHAPVTPYGAAKDFAHTMVQVYRRRGMFASAAILYNHESPRRPSSFVARKITRAVASIARGSQDKLVLGNIDVLRDWGYAPDHVDGMLRILAAERAGRLRGGDRGGPQRPRLRGGGLRGGRGERLEGARGDRPGAVPPRRPARPGRRRLAATIARLAARGGLRGPGLDHGAGRPGRARPPDARARPTVTRTHTRRLGMSHVHAAPATA